jgi:hypothetical protein
MNNGFSEITGSLISGKCFQRDHRDTGESMKRGSLITIISSTSCSRMVLENHLLALGRALFYTRTHIFCDVYVPFINIHVQRSFA